MRNQMIASACRITGLVYAAEGKLDNHAVSLHAWDQGRLTLEFGPCSLSLSAGAMIELISHLSSAMDGVVASLEKQAKKQGWIMRKQINQEMKAQVKELGDALEMKIDTATVLAEITLDNAISGECAEGSYLNSRRAQSLMQAQIYLSQSITDDFFKLMDLVEVANA
ncbi:hypothetical protein OMD46_20240 [Pseudomonas sp. MDMC_285]|nr:hypothetical protein [Pseudomonas sp. MDMC_285]